MWWALLKCFSDRFFSKTLNKPDISTTIQWSPSVVVYKNVLAEPLIHKKQNRKCALITGVIINNSNKDKGSTVLLKNLSCLVLATQAYTKMLCAA